MSYILDALRKSELERRRGEVPEVTHFDEMSKRKSFNRFLWPVIVGALIVINVLVVVIWSPWSQPIIETADHDSSVVVPEHLQANKNAHTLLEESAASTKHNIIVAPLQKPLPSSALKPSHQGPNTVYLPQVNELPSEIKQRIPDMSFSSHMYAKSSRFRSIIIDGRRLKEGQFYNEEIQVREITEKGVVLGVGDVVFAIDILGQWAN